MLSCSNNREQRCPRLSPNTAHPLLLPLRSTPIPWAGCARSSRGCSLLSPAPPPPRRRRRRRRAAAAAQRPAAARRRRHGRRRHVRRRLGRRRRRRRPGPVPRRCSNKCRCVRWRPPSRSLRRSGRRRRSNSRRRRRGAAAAPSAPLAAAAAAAAAAATAATRCPGGSASAATVAAAVAARCSGRRASQMASARRGGARPRRRPAGPLRRCARQAQAHAAAVAHAQARRRRRPGCRARHPLRPVAAALPLRRAVRIRCCSSPPATPATARARRGSAGCPHRCAFGTGAAGGAPRLLAAALAGAAAAAAQAAAAAAAAASFPAREPRPVLASARGGAGSPRGRERAPPRVQTAGGGADGGRRAPRLGLARPTRRTPGIYGRTMRHTPPPRRNAAPPSLTPLIRLPPLRYSSSEASSASPQNRSRS